MAADIQVRRTGARSEANPCLLPSLPRNGARRSPPPQRTALVRRAAPPPPAEALRQSAADSIDGFLPRLLSSQRNSQGGGPANQFPDARNGLLASRWRSLAYCPRAQLRALLHGRHPATRL